MRDGNASILGGGAPTTKGPVAGKKPNKAKGPTSAPEVPPTRWFRVLEAKDVPRHGGSFHLHAGKEISSAGYDIAALLRVGVKLEPLENPPLWWVEQQHQAVANMEADEDLADANPRAQMAARGVPGLLDAPEPAPAP
jgi:hypothetical protein